MDFIAGLSPLEFSMTQSATALVIVTVQGILLLALVGLVMATWKGSAARRHAALVAAMAGLLALPVVSWLLPGWNVAHRLGFDELTASRSFTPALAPEHLGGGGSEERVWLDESDSVTTSQAALAVDAMNAETPGNAPTDRAGETRVAAELSTEHTSIEQASPAQILTAPSLTEQGRANAGPSTRWSTAAWLLAIWGAVAALLLSRLVASEFGLWLLARRSRLLASGKVWEAVEQMRSRMSIGPRLRVYWGRERQIPMTWGLLSPHLLLPSDVEQWSEGCLRSVLMHELAHVRRRDCLTELLSQVACALSWMNPLVWLAARQMDVERERACDDVALAAGVRADQYAEHLVAIASGWGRPELAALAMARPSSMAGRLSAILNSKTDRRRVNGLTRLATVAVLSALVLPIAMLRGGATADDEQPKTSGNEEPRGAAAADAKATENNQAAENREEAKDPADVEAATWSKPIGGLQFRLSAPRAVFEAWELPTWIIEVRNSGDKAVTAQTIKQVFEHGNRSGLRFFFKDQHKQAPNQNRWVMPKVRFDLQKFVGLAAGEMTSETVTMAATWEESHRDLGKYALTAGRYTIGLGVLEAHLTADLTTNSVTLTVLPPGVQEQKELKRYLRPYSAGETGIVAGFVPNKLTLVEGEPTFATFMVENRGDEPFSFKFGGDYRGVGRHNRFKIAVIGPDGKQVEDPLKQGGDFGGISGPRTALGHDTAVVTVELLKYRTITGPGKYQVTCRFDLTPSWNDGKKEDFNVPVETTYELTILPRDAANVQRVLDEWFVEANKSGSLALDGLIEMISSFGQESAVAGLQTMGAEGDVEHRATAAMGLGKVASASAMAALLQMNRDAVVEVRAAVIESLGAFADERALEAVMQALTDSDELIRKTAATALGQMKTNAAIEALIERLPKSDPEVRAAILRSMGTSKSPRVFPIIVESLKSSEDAIWRAALDAIVNFPAKEAADALRPYAANGPAVRKLPKTPKQPAAADPDMDPREAELRKEIESLMQPIKPDPDMDFREAVVQKLAESLKQPVEMEWLTPVIKSRKGARSIGDAPRLMRLHGGEQAVPALLSCLDFENPSVRSYYNMTIIEQQLACRGAIAIPWHADLNRDGTAAETEENRQTLRKLKAWVDYCRTHGSKAGLPPRDLHGNEGEKGWGEGVDDLSIRAWVNRDIWPAGLPQVVSFDARDLPGKGKGSWGTVNFSSVPEILEVEINSEWYALAKEAKVSVCGAWNSYHGSRWQDLQLDGRWRRKTDGQALELKPGPYTVRVAISRTPTEKRTGLATSKPVTFEVISTQ